MELRIHHRAPGELIAERGPLFMRVVNGVETSPRSVELLATQLDRMLERWPVVAVLVVVEHGSPQPMPDVRRRVEQELRRFGDRIMLGYALLGLGFWKAAAEEFGAARASTLRTPVLVTGSVEELAARVAFELIGVSPALISSSLAQLQAELLSQ